jgi:hypothetical protein
MKNIHEEMMELWQGFFIIPFFYHSKYGYENELPLFNIK